MYHYRIERRVRVRFSQLRPIHQSAIALQSRVSIHLSVSQYVNLSFQVRRLTFLKRDLRSVSTTTWSPLTLTDLYITTARGLRTSRLYTNARIFNPIVPFHAVNVEFLPPPFPTRVLVGNRGRIERYTHVRRPPPSRVHGSYKRAEHPPGIRHRAIGQRSNYCISWGSASTRPGRSPEIDEI